MAVNYYDQFQPLTYNPMTLQEMLIGPQMMQQRHDQYQALLDQEGLFDVPALDVDKPGVQQWMDKYKGEINNLSDQLLRSGYNKDLSRRARQILQEKQQAVSSRGYLGKANAAYQQYLNNVESEKKRLEKGEINRDQFERGIATALQRYNEAGGVNADASYSPWYSTKAVDLQELVSKYGKEITPQTIASDLGLQYDPEKGVFMTGSKKVVQLDKKRIADVIGARIASNPEAMAYMKEREALGLAGPVELQLLSLGLQGAETFFRNDSELKRNYDTSNALTGSGGDSFDPNTPDTRGELVVMPWRASENLAEVAKKGKPKYSASGNVSYFDAVTSGSSFSLGEPGKPVPFAVATDNNKIINLEESNKARAFANEQIDKDWEILKQFDPHITRDEVLKMEDNWAKSNKTTAVFKYAPTGTFEPKYQQELDLISKGGLPGPIADYYLDGEPIKSQSKYIDKISFSSSNPITNVMDTRSATGAARYSIIMKDGAQHELLRKPQETDKGKFAVANLLEEKLFNNERGNIEFIGPNGMPIKMTKWISPEGIQATVTMSMPLYNVKGQLKGYEEEQTMSYNQAISKLTNLVLKHNYQYKHAKPRSNFPTGSNVSN